jgi:hypothetical protein
MSNVKTRINKLEESAGVVSGGCLRCADAEYLPDAQNSDRYYYAHMPCPTCGRMITFTVHVIYDSEELKGEAA